MDFGYVSREANNAITILHADLMKIYNKAQPQERDKNGPLWKDYLAEKNLYHLMERALTQPEQISNDDIEFIKNNPSTIDKLKVRYSNNMPVIKELEKVNQIMQTAKIRLESASTRINLYKKIYKNKNNIEELKNLISKHEDAIGNAKTELELLSKDIRIALKDIKILKEKIASTRDFLEVNPEKLAQAKQAMIDSTTTLEFSIKHLEYSRLYAYSHPEKSPQEIQQEVRKQVKNEMQSVTKGLTKTPGFDEEGLVTGLHHPAAESERQEMWNSIPELEEELEQSKQRLENLQAIKGMIQEKISKK